jgi:hypothetical protein
MKSTLRLHQWHIHVVMPAWVGKSVGAVRCQSGWVASHVRGMWVALRGSGLQIVALAMRHNVSICVRAGLPKPRGVPDTERIKYTKTLDYTSTPLDANTLLVAVGPFSALHS